MMDSVRYRFLGFSHQHKLERVQKALAHRFYCLCPLLFCDFTGASVSFSTTTPVFFDLLQVLQFSLTSIPKRAPSTYRGAMGSELGNALAAVRWGSDYVLKTFKAPSLQYAQVGDGNTDHAW